MSFWNPWNDNQNTSSVVEQTNHHNPNESLNRLIHTDLFNNLDTSNLNDKFTFLDETCNQLLANESPNHSTLKENSNEIKEEEQEPQEVNFFTNSNQQLYQTRYTPPVSGQHGYLPEDYANYTHYQTTYMNNLRPSSVLSSVSSNDYSSDFDSSISSTSTDCRRYSPNIYNHQVNLRNQQLASLSYPVYNDPRAFAYGNEFYYQANVDPNYYYYNNNQFRHQPVKSVEPISSLSRSQSTQSLNLFKPSEETKINLTESKPKSIQSIPKHPNTELTKKKPIPNMNDLNAFRYPSTNKINPNIKINLQDFDLWMQFKQLGTEMIITKSGRRMFPVLRFSITGLDEKKRYIVFIDILPTETENRYKYNPKTGWIKGVKSEPHVNNKIYIHPETPMMGSILMNQILSFHKIKLTNSILANESTITLNSMHRYIPRLHVIEEGESVTTFNLDDCVFFAVTSYQNDMVTRLKIQHNPYAKGFKDNTEKSKSKRPDYNNDYNNLSSKPKFE